MVSRIVMMFAHETNPFLLDVNSLMYDLELLYDLQVLLYERDYSKYRFSYRFFYRNGRPVKPEHRLRTFRITKDSPLGLDLVILGVDIFILWKFLEAIMKIDSYRLNRQETQLEIQKLKLEIERMKSQAKEDLERRVREREADGILLELVDRLNSNPIKLEVVRFEFDGHDIR